MTVGKAYRREAGMSVGPHASEEKKLVTSGGGIKTTIETEEQTESRPTF